MSDHSSLTNMQCGKACAIFGRDLLAADREICYEIPTSFVKHDVAGRPHPDKSQLPRMPVSQMEMRRPVSDGMRYAPKDRRAQGAMQRRPAYEKELHRGKSLIKRVRMEGWRQRRVGFRGRPLDTRGNYKTDLTLTGLLMEGLDCPAPAFRTAAL